MDLPRFVWFPFDSLLRLHSNFLLIPSFIFLYSVDRIRLEEKVIKTEITNKQENQRKNHWRGSELWTVPSWVLLRYRNSFLLFFLSSQVLSLWEAVDRQLSRAQRLFHLPFVVSSFWSSLSCSIPTQIPFHKTSFPFLSTPLRSRILQARP